MPSGYAGKPDASQVWSALAEIGRQLQLLAGAQSAQGDSFVHASPLPIYGAPALSVTELVNLFLVTKAKAGKSDRYLRALHYNLKKFVASHGRTLARDVSIVDVESWIENLRLMPRTRRGYLSDLRTLFNFGVRRGIVASNPAAAVELPVEIQGPVTIHTPEQVASVLKVARDYDPDILRALAVRYFSGLRTAEAERLTDEEVQEKYIEVTALKSKTRSRRLVTIQPNLRAWLSLGGHLPAPPQNGRRMLEFQRHLRRVDLTWPKNVARHSFVSYHLAKFQNAGKTALEAGHTEQMLFAHYREIVTREAGKAYFDILP